MMNEPLETIPDLGAAPTDLGAYYDRFAVPDKWRNEDRYRDRLSKTNRYGELQREFGGGKTPPLLWGTSENSFESSILAAFQSSYKSARGAAKPKLPKRLDDLAELQRRLRIAQSGDDVRNGAILAVHLAELAPQVLAREPAVLGWRLLEILSEWIDLANESPPSDPCVAHWLSVELPLTLVHQLPEIVSLHPLVAEAAQSWEEIIAQTIDEQGFLAASQLHNQLEFLGGLFRSWKLMHLLGRREFPADVVQRLGFVFRNLPQASLEEEFFERRGQRRFAALAESLLGRKSIRRILRQSEGFQALGASSEGAERTRMLSERGPRGAKVFLQHGAGDFRISVWRRQSLLRGIWRTDVQLGSNRIPFDHRWRVAAWQEDDDAQTAVLVNDWGNGLTLERLVVLGAADEFLFVADTLTASQPGAWSYTSRLPLAPGVVAKEAPENSESFLQSDERVLSVAVPLAAAEWKSAQTGVSLTPKENELQLRHQQVGIRLFAPLFLDLRPKRSRQPCTWRTLTVAQNRIPQSADVAVGYRVRVGGKQWLIFRAFAPGPFSVLSMHLMSKFYIGRIEKDQSISDLVSID